LIEIGVKGTCSAHRIKGVPFQNTTPHFEIAGVPAHKNDYFELIDLSGSDNSSLRNTIYYRKKMTCYR